MQFVQQLIPRDVAKACISCALKSKPALPAAAEDEPVVADVDGDLPEPEEKGGDALHPSLHTCSDP